MLHMQLVWPCVSALRTDSIKLPGWIVVISCDLMLTSSRRNPPKMVHWEFGDQILRCPVKMWLNNMEWRRINAGNVSNDCLCCFTNGYKWIIVECVQLNYWVDSLNCGFSFGFGGVDLKRAPLGKLVLWAKDVLLFPKIVVVMLCLQVSDSCHMFIQNMDWWIQTWNKNSEWKPF